MNKRNSHLGSRPGSSVRRASDTIVISTSIICSSALFLVLYVDTLTSVDDIFTETASLFGAALALAFIQEARSGIKHLIRTDNLMLCALYGLIFAEFLFPQQSFALMLSLKAAQNGTIASLWGFFGIALGRHVVLNMGAGSVMGQPHNDFSPQTLLRVFIVIAFFGYLNILLAVSFDIVEAVRQMTLRRFAQSWSRGALGGWHSLLTELELLTFLIPPLSGVIFARFRAFNFLALLIVALVLALTLFKGFASGTRSVFLINLLMFCGAFILARPAMGIVKSGLFLGALLLVAGVGSNYMLAFRNVGLSRFELSEFESETLYVDLNLINICQLTEAFPSKHDYLGFEIPYWIIIRPIPRAIWPGKPTGLSVGIEEALGAEGLTLSATFVGETYMSGGLFAVIVAALIIGSVAGSWDRLGRRVGSTYGLILYCSGFFAAALAMRSVLQVAPAVLPTLALWLYGRIYIAKRLPPDGHRPRVAASRRSGNGRG